MANEVKTCPKCRIVKPLTEFSPGRKRPGGGVYPQARCKPCKSEDAMLRRDKNPDIQLNAHLRRVFGITLAQYDALLAEQAGVCAICGEPPTRPLGPTSRRQGRFIRPRLVVDHDHTTGKIRGLLCAPCNKGIGFLKDDPDVVRFALKYLEERS